MDLEQFNEIKRHNIEKQYLLGLQNLKEICKALGVDYIGYKNR
jgi:enamine deaminase RidA (YjgF/YER057c/UK114 family)